jgi:hypothetical protein
VDSDLDNISESTIILNCLLTAFPEKGLELFNTLDYWECRDLLSISSNGKINSEDNNQKVENNIFNNYLDRYSNKKVAWFDLKEKLNLYEIKDYTINAIENSDVIT